jgi:hypothetical protein
MREKRGEAMVHGTREYAYESNDMTREKEWIDAMDQAREESA